MLKTQISRWPMQPVRGVKSQRSGRDFEALGQPLGAQAAGKRAQCQRLQTRAQRQTYTAQREICHSALQLTALDVCPQPYRATALLQVGPEVSKLSQQPQVNAVCGAVQLPLPIAPAPCLQGQQGLHKTPSQAEALAQQRRRCGIDMNLVSSPLVAQDHLHLLQLQRWGRAQLVGPFDAAALKHQLMLGKKPIGQTLPITAAARQI